MKRTFNNQSTYFYYNGEQPILEQGAASASNIYGLGIDEIAIRFEPTDVKYFYQDHEGSVTHVRNNAGTMIETYRYDTFGQPTIKSGSGQVITTSAINNRFMFTGREWAPVNLGFYEYRARADHPGLGRFMSEDPKGYDAGDYNLYRYCGSEPEDRVDPSGMLAGIFNPGDWLAHATGWNDPQQTGYNALSDTLDWLTQPQASRRLWRGRRKSSTQNAARPRIETNMVQLPLTTK